MPGGKASIGMTKPAIVERSLKDRHCTPWNNPQRKKSIDKPSEGRFGRARSPTTLFISLPLGAPLKRRQVVSFLSCPLVKEVQFQPTFFYIFLSSALIISQGHKIRNKKKG
jgi:hypothetical protein